MDRDVPFAQLRNGGTAHAARVQGSALWAAWGDALGFITELTDVDGLRHRAGVSKVETTMPWRRVIGGKFGASINLPAGCYSDDTQLRLATCRSIRSDGELDLQALAKVELPAFLAYSLGAGRGTKAAATNLSRPAVKWSGNTFSNKEIRYGDGGGNGAAMRIQPHVWACRTLQDPRAVLRDVVRNAVITHGHPVGILGACWHALDLAQALQTGSVSADAWTSHRDALSALPSIIQEDEQLRMRWVPMWEEHTGKDIKSAIVDGVHHLTQLLDALPSTLVRDRRGAYEKVLSVVGGAEAATRGSGTGTALAASWLAAAGSESPVEALRLAANALHSDTDTIATMAGALLGCTEPGELPGPLLDAPYISYEAQRLARIAAGDRSTHNFGYPDLLHMVMPKTALDLVGLVDGKLALAGLGWLTTLDEPKSAGSGPAVFQLVLRHTDDAGLRAEPRYEGEQMGLRDRPTRPLVPTQTLLIKRREHPRALAQALIPVGLKPAPAPRKPPDAKPTSEAESPTSAENRAKRGIGPHDDDRNEQLPIEGLPGGQVGKRDPLPKDASDSSHSGHGQPRRVTIEEALERCARQGYSPDVVGRAVLALLEQENGLTLAGTFVGMLAARRR